MRVCERESKSACVCVCVREFVCCSVRVCFVCERGGGRRTRGVKKDGKCY